MGWYSTFQAKLCGKRLMRTGISKISVAVYGCSGQCAVVIGEPNNVVLPVTIVEPNQLLTLKDYVDYAEAHNAGLKNSYHQWVAATKKVVQAKTLPDPQLTYGYYMPPS